MFEEVRMHYGTGDDAHLFPSAVVCMKNEACHIVSSTSVLKTHFLKLFFKIGFTYLYYLNDPLHSEKS